MLLNIPAIVLCNVLACMTGLAVFAFFSMSGCDPLANRDIQNPNQVYNSYVRKIRYTSLSVSLFGWFLPYLLEYTHEFTSNYCKGCAYGTRNKQLEFAGDRNAGIYFCQKIQLTVTGYMMFTKYEKRWSYYATATKWEHKAKLLSVYIICPSVCLSHASILKLCVLELWLL